MFDTSDWNKAKRFTCKLCGVEIDEVSTPNKSIFTQVDPNATDVLNVLIGTYKGKTLMVSRALSLGTNWIVEHELPINSISFGDDE